MELRKAFARLQVRWPRLSSFRTFYQTIFADTIEGSLVLAKLELVVSDVPLARATKWKT